MRKNKKQPDIALVLGRRNTAAIGALEWLTQQYGPIQIESRVKEHQVIFLVTVRFDEGAKVVGQAGELAEAAHQVMQRLQEYREVQQEQVATQLKRWP